MNNLELETAAVEPLPGARPATVPDLRALYPSPDAACSREDFLSNVEKHEMSIKMDTDDGYRHIGFRSPSGGQIYAFELVTWPGHLSVSGDCGCFVFSRAHSRDMFAFFRPQDYEKPESGLFINPGYWGQKCVSRTSSELSAFTSETFKAQVADWCADDEDLTAEQWQQIEDRVMAHADDGHEAAVRAAMEFEFEVQPGQYPPLKHHHRRAYFDDFYERDCTEWDVEYLWCLYAIAWGIQQYDAHKKAEADRKRATLLGRIQGWLQSLNKKEGEQ